MRKASASGSEESDEDSSEENLKQDGFCHFNEDSSKLEFEIDLFGHVISILQCPIVSDLGHGRSKDFYFRCQAVIIRHFERCVRVGCEHNIRKICRNQQ